MEQQTNLQKNIGIFIGCMIACSVLVVTIAASSQSGSTSIASINQTTNTTTVPTQNTVSSNTTNTTTIPKTTTTPTQNPSTKPVVTQTPPVDVPKKTTSVYKNGTYSATGSYNSPGGYDQLGVTVTLANDIITSASITPGAGDRTSQRYQDRFISGYQQYVIGKNIANVNLTVVSGSSLTPRGFNDALAQIKSQAKA